MSDFLILDGTKPPIDKEKLKLWPRYGMSIAGLLTCSAHQIDNVVAKFIEAGVNLTRINLLSALWPDQGEAKIDTLPYRQTADGRWDLYDWNPAYFARLEYLRDAMNRAGIVIQWTNYELYSWSDRKKGPQQINTPWRHNVNGVYWDPSDLTLGVLPDGWSYSWFQKIEPYLNLDVNVFEVGNEFPEKSLHEEVADALPPDSLVQVNRNEDTPGQYKNMKIGGGRYDFIAYHGSRLKELSDLDRVYPREPDYKTFRQFMDKCPHEHKRVVFSSDGARISADPVNTYDWDKLREWFREMKRRGYSIEHQSRAKMTPAPNHDMIEIDWFKSVVN